MASFSKFLPSIFWIDWDFPHKQIFCEWTILFCRNSKKKKKLALFCCVIKILRLYVYLYLHYERIHTYKAFDRNSMYRAIIHIASNTVRFIKYIYFYPFLHTNGILMEITKTSKCHRAFSKCWYSQRNWWYDYVLTYNMLPLFTLFIIALLLPATTRIHNIHPVPVHNFSSMFWTHCVDTYFILSLGKTIFPKWRKGKETIFQLEQLKKKTWIAHHRAKIHM